MIGFEIWIGILDWDEKSAGRLQPPGAFAGLCGYMNLFSARTGNGVITQTHCGTHPSAVWTPDSDPLRMAHYLIVELFVAISKQSHYPAFFRIDLKRHIIKALVGDKSIINIINTIVKPFYMFEDCLLWRIICYDGGERMRGIIWNWIIPR